MQTTKPCITTELPFTCPLWITYSIVIHQQETQLKVKKSFYSLVFTKLDLTIRASTQADSFQAQVPNKLLRAT